MKTVLILVAWLGAFLCAAGTKAGVAARYVRVENPTGCQMELTEIEVFSGGKNIVFKHGDMFSGTVYPDHNIKTRDGNDVTDGRKDTKQRGAYFVVPSELLNPWFEIDLGKSVEIDKIILYAAQYPQRSYLDKGHRVVSALDNDRRVVWAAKWNCYETSRYPDGIFTFIPAAEKSPVIGMRIPANAPDWVPMGWLMDAEESKPAPDGEMRMKRFAERDSPASTEKLARQFFALVESDVPELADARRLFANGRYAEALESWKQYWFAKMRRVHLHAALRTDYFSYKSQGDDLLQGIAVTIGPTSARAIRITPGQIRWIDLPDPKNDSAMRVALTDCEQKAKVGKVARPLLDAYRDKPDAKYLQRWSEIMDDWSLNFFEEAAQTPYEVEMLFTFSPAHDWGSMMEDLSDIATSHPAAISQIPASTLARIQLISLEKYSTAWWRQSRETVFNHVTGGIYAWATLLPYIDEFGPGRRAAREWRQEFERWMTLGTQPDGSSTEIGDEGHFEIATVLGFPLARLETTKPDWYTLGWRNRALAWFDNVYAYMTRHLAPGGYEHRFAVSYRPHRWTSTTKPYFPNHPKAPAMLSRDEAFFSNPEIRRLLDAFGHISVGLPDPKTDPLRRPVIETQKRIHDEIQAILGNDKPGMPHINSDWMPYTGAYYFRGGWEDEAAFLAMMACGSHGGSQPTQWPYGMYYHYDYNYPLMRCQPTQIDGLPPNQLYGRRTFQPGTKTDALTNAEEKPAPHRWHSSSRFDFGEAVYRGAYQKLPGFKNPWDYQLEIQPEGKAIKDVQTTRQILHLRDSRLFIVTESNQMLAPEDKNQAHQFSIPYKMELSTKKKDPSKPFGPEQLMMDAKAACIASNNPDGPSVTMHQFAGFPIQYRRGSEAKIDFRSYSPRLTDNIGIAEQEVFAEFKGAGEWVLVNLISSRQPGAKERIATIEPMNNGAAVTGFHARLRDGGEIWYQTTAAAEGAPLVCGPAQATAQALLAVTGKTPTEISGMLLGGKSLSLNGKPVTLKHPDLEFSKGGSAVAAGIRGASDLSDRSDLSDASDPGLKMTRIFTPINPISFLPNRNTFAEKQTVEMISKTPNTQIRYTTDGTQPTRNSKLYTGPLTITESTEFAARAYRLGSDGKPLAAEDFEINGTRFSAPTYGWFYKKPLKPAVEIAEQDLSPGLNYDYLQAPWWRLYASAHWLDAARVGVAPREMDISSVATSDSYAMRYKGCIRVPEDGVYTFHAPYEFVHMDNAPSYDLRLYIDGEEWYLTQWRHGHGTWSVPLKKGFHSFQLDFADARVRPWRKTGIWRYYPRPWVIYQGKPGDILVSGPGLDRARIPEAWFYRSAR